MTLLKGFAAGTPGFGPNEAQSGALVVAKAHAIWAPAQRPQAIVVLEAARQV